MKKIIIIGAGIAGITALMTLRRFRGDLDVTLIDRNTESSFLPLLPDVIGRGIKPLYLDCDFRQICREAGFKFVHSAVSSLNLDKREVITDSGIFTYDYVLIASGSETNFYGNDRIKEASFKLDDSRDARVISEALGRGNLACCLVVGGGYTGIETASNLYRYFTRRQEKIKIFIVERASSILGPLPEWMKGYVLASLKNMGIEVLTGATIVKLEKASVYLSNGSIFRNAMVIWAAGVKTSGYLDSLKAEKGPQGRILVDEYLRLDLSCFAAGDAALFKYKDGYLRMAVQFAIAQGSSAALNIVRSIRGRRIIKYKPRDLGYIIPMANNRACGIIMGIGVNGRFPLILHYAMCLYRLRGLYNKWGVFKDLISGGVLC
ncbi:MAG: FAD-dependent oxidoreductase [Candidatus Omnitrophota bacterium]